MKKNEKKTAPGKKKLPVTAPVESSAECPSAPLSGSRQISRYAIIVLLIILGISLYPVMKSFVIPIMLAATFTTLFYPLYKAVCRFFRGNHLLGSFVSCLILMICLVGPLYTVMHLIVAELFHFYQSFGPVLKGTVAHGGSSQLLQKAGRFIPTELIGGLDVNIANVINDVLKSLASLASRAFNKTSASFLGLFTTIVITFFTMFYFFIDGEKLIKHIKFLSPIRDDYEEMIFSRFLMISRATVMGTIIIGVIQGTLGAVTLLVFGVKSWLLWGFVMIFLSIVPMVGAWAVLVPAALYQLLSGHIGQGIAIFLICVIVISNIDNLIRPRLVGKEAKLHDLIIFFSSLGGIAAFGIMGFIVGPVIAALFVSVLDIYGIEFKAQLEEANRL